MQNEPFKFDEISNLEAMSFDRSLRDFYELGLDATIRENIQNSLDAHNPDTDKPVKVNITIDEINTEDIPGIDQVFEHIDSLKYENQYSEEIINNMKRQKNSNAVKVMTIEDENTKGLSGASDDPTRLSPNNSFYPYAYKKGSHPVSEDEGLEKKRGGSHGKGKIANNAASTIHLMFFANHDENGEEYLGGNIQLIDHSFEYQSYRSTGYYSDIVSSGMKTNLKPKKNESSNPLFQKKTRGLKNIIPYLREEYFETSENGDKNIQQTIVTAVCDGFFWAIIHNNLNVNVSIKDYENIMINEETIYDIINNDYFYTSDVREMKKNYTSLYIQTIKETEPRQIKVNHWDDTFKFNLYLTFNPEIPKGRVAILRTVGMKIDDFGVTGMKTKPFNGVLIGGSKEDNYLKTLENESHTEISRDFVTEKKEKKNATNFINNLGQAIKAEVNQLIETNSPSDGVMDTGDLFFESTRAFKKSISEHTEVAKTNKGKKYRKTKAKEKRKPKNGSNKKPSTNTGRKKTRRPRRVQPNVDYKEVETTLIVPSEAVNRVITQNNEILSIDFTEFGSDAFSRCDIQIMMVDGEGKEIDDRFSIKHNFNSIADFTDNQSIDFDERNIYDVAVKNKRINLKFDFKENYNKNLKYVYKVVIKDDL